MKSIVWATIWAASASCRCSVTSGREVLHFDDSAGPTAAFSPDGRHLALMTAVWDVAGALAAPQVTDAPTTVTWQERLFDYADPFIEFVAPSSAIDSAFVEPGSVSYSPDGRRLLTTVISSLAVMRDAATGEALFTLTGHTSIINGTAFGPAGALVATASADGTARVWDAESGQIRLVLEGHGDEVVHLAFSPDGQSLATSSLDGTTKVWDITPGGRAEWPVSGQHNGATTVAFAPQAPHLLMTGPDGTAVIFDLQSGQQTNQPDAGTNRSQFEGADAQFTVVIASTFSPDGVYLALAAPNAGAIHLFDAATGAQTRTFQLDRAALSLAFSPDNQRLFVGSDDGVLSIFAVATGELIAEWVVQAGFVNSLVPSRDGARLAIAGGDGDIIVVDLDDVLAAQSAAAEPGRLPAAAIMTTMHGHTNVIPNLELSQDGTRYLSASWDGTARIWDAASGQLLLTFAGHSGRVWDAAFTPDGTRVVSGGSDGSLILWDAESGEQLFVLASQPVEIMSLAFSADGKFLAAATADGSVRVYVLPIDDLIELARGRLTRELSDAECRRYLHVAGCPIS